MLLHENKEQFIEIIQAVAGNTEGLETYQVEKDYFVSLFLKELSKLKNNVEIVFKGGTSLSKCYSVIDRFSEDIDLTMKFDNKKAGEGLRKRLKQNIVKTINKLGMKFINADSVQSDRDFNYYKVEFDREFSVESEMLPHIIIETIAVYKPYPYEIKTVSNYITKYLKENDELEIIKKYELEAFEMTIQSIERTFIDKLFAICDYHIQGKYNRYSRHIYDLHMIWSSGILDNKVLAEIIELVVKDRQLYKERNQSCIPGTDPSKIISEIIISRVYEDDYNNVTLGFIQKPVEYEVCIDTLRIINKQNILPKIIKQY